MNIDTLPPPEAAIETRKARPKLIGHVDLLISDMKTLEDRHQVRAALSEIEGLVEMELGKRYASLSFQARASTFESILQALRREGFHPSLIKTTKR